MCMFIYLFVVYFSFAPVISAITHLYCELFYIQVLTMVIITETLTSTSHHDIFTYLDNIFSCYLHIYIYINVFLFFVGPEREKVNISKWIGPHKDLHFLKKYLFPFYISVCFQLFAFVREHTWHMAILIGHPTRLELTRVSLLNFLMFCISLYKGHCFVLNFSSSSYLRRK